jgi:carbon storage regulator
MLILTRKVGERIVIGDCVTVTVVACRGGRVRLGFHAPPEIDILREEVGSAFREVPPMQEEGEARRPTRKG